MGVRQARDTMGAQVQGVAPLTGLVAVNLAMAPDKGRMDNTLVGGSGKYR